MHRPPFVHVSKNRPPENHYVCIGSPAEGELHRGDIITRIGNKDASRMSHQTAQNAIKSAGTSLNLTVQRSGHPIPVQNSHPPSFQPSYYGSSTLPRSHFNDAHAQRRFVPPPPQNYPAAVNAEDHLEKEIERHSIVSQPHRTFPLITPSIKVKHDLPTGSYLRHVSDPFAKSREATMKAKLQESVLNASSGRSTGSSPARSATPEVLGTIGPNTNIIHRQYNSPLPLYSHQNVLETIAGQTGVTPHRKGDIKFFDITKSPTYQAIYEEEWNKKELAEHRPVHNKVKIIPPPPQYNDEVNPLGVPRDKILQSRSFELIQHSLVGQSDL